MDYTAEISQLYSNVFDIQRRKFNISNISLRNATKEMGEAYAPNPSWEYDYTNKVTDYNDAAHRCAYMHKYAMVHSGLMCEIFQKILQRPDINRHLRSKGKLNLCSLGGGPGTEIVSFLFVLQESIGSVQCNVTVIDYSLEWQTVFEDVINLLKSGIYGPVRNIVSSWYFSYNYLSADLLNMSYYNAYKVQACIKNADVVTMIKFVSAAACDKTRSMSKVCIYVYFLNICTFFLHFPFFLLLKNINKKQIIAGT